MLFKGQMCYMTCVEVLESQSKRNPLLNFLSVSGVLLSSPPLPAPPCPKLQTTHLAQDPCEVMEALLVCEGGNEPALSKSDGFIM